MNQQHRDALQLQADFHRDTHYAEALRAAVALYDRTPKTADGVAIVAGMEIYDPWIKGAAIAGLRSQSGSQYPIEAVGWGKNVAGSEVYSTREAAEAAQRLANGPHDHDHMDDQ